jgi:hypothetical protein
VRTAFSDAVEADALLDQRGQVQPAAADPGGHRGEVRARVAVGAEQPGLAADDRADRDRDDVLPDADEDDGAAGRDRGHRAGDGLRPADAVDDEVGARGRVAGRDRVQPEHGGQRAPLGLRLDEDRLQAAAAPGERGPEADDAAADDEEATAGGDIVGTGTGTDANTMEPDREGLDERTPLGRHALGEGVGAGGRHDERVGVRTGRVGHAAMDAALGAEVVVAGGTARARAAAGHRVDRDERPERRAVDAGPQGADAAHGLVPHDEDVTVAAQDLVAARVDPGDAVDVRPAEADGEHLDAQLARTRDGARGLVDGQAPGAVVGEAADGGGRGHRRSGPRARARTVRRGPRPGRGAGPWARRPCRGRTAPSTWPGSTTARPPSA